MHNGKSLLIQFGKSIMLWTQT